MLVNAMKIIAAQAINTPATGKNRPKNSSFIAVFSDI